MSARIFLIRHGHTDWNVEKRYLSFTDIDLNEDGRSEAARLSVKMSGERIDRVYSSDLKRAFNFASIVFKGASIYKMTELGEMAFGIFEGMCYESLMKIYPEIYRRWLDDPFASAIPGGEDPAVFRHRVRMAFGKIIEESQGVNTVVVSHAGPIRAIIADITGTYDIRNVPADPASVTIINRSRKGRPEVEVLNDTSYLNHG